MDLAVMQARSASPMSLRLSSFLLASATWALRALRLRFMNFIVPLRLAPPPGPPGPRPSGPPGRAPGWGCLGAGLSSLAGAGLDSGCAAMAARARPAATRMATTGRYRLDMADSVRWCGRSAGRIVGRGERGRRLNEHGRDWCRAREEDKTFRTARRAMRPGCGGQQPAL